VSYSIAYGTDIGVFISVDSVLTPALRFGGGPNSGLDNAKHRLGNGFRNANLADFGNGSLQRTYSGWLGNRYSAGFVNPADAILMEILETLLHLQLDVQQVGVAAIVVYSAVATALISLPCPMRNKDIERLNKALHGEKAYNAI
jgi:nitrate/nitrite transporter NarK